LGQQFFGGPFAMRGANGQLQKAGQKNAAEGLAAGR